MADKPHHEQLQQMRFYFAQLLKQITLLRRVPPIVAIGGCTWAVNDRLDQFLREAAGNGQFDDAKAASLELIKLLHDEVVKTIETIETSLKDPHRPTQPPKSGVVN